MTLIETPRHGGGEKLNPCLRALAGNQAGGRLRGRLNSQPAGRDIPWEGLRANTATGSPKGGIETLGKVEIDCCKAAPKEEQGGDPANQMSGSERVKPETYS